jgi:hypothetical protein
MSERKTITINPELFSLSGGNTTRKKRTPDKDIKIRSEPKPERNNKTLRNRLLHYIRKNQEDNYRKLHGSKPEIQVHVPYKQSYVTEKFNSDFEESVKYMNAVSEQIKEKIDNEQLMNRTLKNYNSINPNSIVSDSIYSSTSNTNNNSLDIPVVSDFPNISDNNPIHIKSPPKWGCMKGGQLPTYRNWLNQTQRNTENIETRYTSNNRDIDDSHVLPNSTITSYPNHHHNTSPPFNGGMDKNNEMSYNITDTSRIPSIPIFDRTTSEMKQIASKISTTNEAKEKYKIRYGKQKKTIRKTYTLGKSKVTPKVSVLISNKTVRKNISTKKEKLKQVPIDEIRRILIKRGFIKVGSLATNDVLRKMYESMLLVCGEVENHNPDNLLYNYLHAT